MKNVDRIEYLKQLLSKGIFPNEKNRIWTMCQATLHMLIMTVAEAERTNMVNEQFYLLFEDAVNELSVKDHYSDDSLLNIRMTVEQFKEFEKQTKAALDNS